jgi:endonuclease/exonuclease/phosphatase (EEP) superfamily protein YafD
MSNILLSSLVALTAFIVVLVTVLPLTRSHRWWVRGWDFPRLQISAVAFATLIAGALLGGVFGWSVAVVMVACLIYQFIRILPLLPVSRLDLEYGAPESDDVTALALNVEMDNRDYDAVCEIIRDESADVLLLMETDAAWMRALEPVLAEYETVLRAEHDDYYGMVFATRLKAQTAEVQRLTDDDTPSMFTVLEDRNGRPFRFVGLHPKPPVPGEDTVERDLQTLYAARFARASDLPVVVMGDFNDAAWSDTARQFKARGEYLDVRAGRGLYCSFHARYWWFRCPIDQLYVTDGVVISDFRIGPYVGSDHFPVAARLRFDRTEANLLMARNPRLSDEDRRELDQQVAGYRVQLEAAQAEME